MRLSFNSKWDSGKVVAQLKSSREDGVTKALEHLLAASLRLCPEDEGDLKKSGQVVMEGPGEGSVQYGTTPETAKYALVQHERMDLNHPKGGQAKYLEAAMTREARRIFQIIGQEYKRRF